MLSFDEAVVQLLGLLGVGTGLLLLAKLVFAAQSWIQGARQMAAGARVAGRAAVGLGRSLVHSPFRPLIAVLATVVVLSVQVYVLGTWYFFGNMASIIYGGDSARQRAAGIAFGNNFWQPSGWDLRLIYDVFTMDLLVAAVVLVGCFLVVRTYALAVRERSVYDGFRTGLEAFDGVLLALPGLIVLAPAFLFALIGIVVLAANVWAVVVTHDNGETWSDVAAEWNNWGGWIVLTLLLIVNFLLCRAAVRGSVAVTRLWRGSVPVKS